MNTDAGRKVMKQLQEIEKERQLAVSKINAAANKRASAILTKYDRGKKK